MADSKPTQNAAPETTPLETLLSGDGDVDTKIDTTRTEVDSALTKVEPKKPVETKALTAVAQVQTEQKGIMGKLFDFFSGKKADKKEETPIPLAPQVQALTAETEDKLKKALNTQAQAANNNIEIQKAA